MMKNKETLKRYLLFTLIISIVLVSIFTNLNIYEHKKYEVNYNNKINSLVNYISEKYPDITNNEIMDILNNKDSNNKILSKYGIDIDKDFILEKNEKLYYKFLFINSLFISLCILLIVIIFLIYNKKKDNQISNITKYIEEINKKNYTLSIDDITEDELSILKNEIYKTTIMLKESAENSLIDKKNLKKSLEDISHQLKTPLTSILIILDNLIEDHDMDNSTKEEFIKDIKREVVNINFLIQALLKLSKFDSNTINFIKKNYLVKDMIDSSIKNVSALLDLKDVEIIIEGNKDIKLNCDLKWQVEAITNIIKNCIEHLGINGKIHINYEQNKVYTSITIKDNGCGIDKSDLPHIFERFYKGKNSSEDSIGIGLSLSKTIIEEDNGSINVTSDKTGSTFIIKYYT